MTLLPTIVLLIVAWNGWGTTDVYSIQEPDITACHDGYADFVKENETTQEYVESKAQCIIAVAPHVELEKTP
jgi:hypothetical protein